MKNENLISLYKKTYLIRFIEEQISKRYSDGLIRCPTHLSIGQEAIAAGVSENLYQKDFVVSSHRSHAHYLAKDGNIYKMLAELVQKGV